MTFNVGFVGGGNMSTAIVQGILKNNAHPAKNIWVSGPHLDNLKQWNYLGTNVVINNYEVFNICDVIFLGIKPHKLEEAINGILGGKDHITNIKRSVLFISMLAGTTIERLHKYLKVLDDYANVAVVRIMPNTPMTVGAGVCLYTPDDIATKKQCDIVEILLKSSALCEKIEEPMMDSLGVLTSCGPAFMFIVIEALADGAVKQGVPRALAMRYASQTVIGSGQLVLQSGKHPGLLKDEVCSPGGSTICGVTALENGNLRAALIKAVEAATLRTKELGQK